MKNLTIVARNEEFIIAHQLCAVPKGKFTNEVYIFRLIEGNLYQTRWGGGNYFNLTDIKTRLLPILELEVQRNDKWYAENPDNWINQEYQTQEKPTTVRLINFLKTL